METKFRVAGLDEALKVLKDLPPNVEKRVLTGAVRAGGTVMRRSIKAAAPMDADGQSPASKKYGRLRDNIQLFKLNRTSTPTNPIFRVSTGAAFWGYFLEFGTRFMAARPWFRPAADVGLTASVNAVKERLAAGIVREAEKLGKKT